MCLSSGSSSTLSRISFLVNVGAGYVTNQSTTLVIGSLTSRRISRLRVLRVFPYPSCPTFRPSPEIPSTSLPFAPRSLPPIEPADLLSPQNLPIFPLRVSFPGSASRFRGSTGATERRSRGKKKDTQTNGRERERGSVTKCNSRYASGTAIALEKIKERQSIEVIARGGRGGGFLEVDSVSRSRPRFALHGRCKRTPLEVSDLKSYYSRGLQPRRPFSTVCHERNVASLFLSSSVFSPLSAPP